MDNKNNARLGKGLSSIFGQDVSKVLDDIQNGDMEVERQEQSKIPVDEIRPNPYQPRKVFDDEALKEYKKLLIMQTPYRLLSSFLVDVGGNDPIWNRPKDIIETIKDYNEKYRLPYIIENDRGLKRRVVVQPEWRDFLMTNYRVIMEWVHDEKIKYLEKRAQ